MSSKHVEYNSNFDDRHQEDRMYDSNNKDYEWSHDRKPNENNSPRYKTDSDNRSGDELQNELRSEKRYDMPSSNNNQSKSESQVNQNSREPINLDDLPIGCTLYIRNLPTHLQNEDIRNHFSVFGEVLDCRIVINPVTKESRGFGFVTYATRELADHALLSMDQTEIDGSRLHIEKARRNKPHDPTPGEYKGPTGACVRYGNRGRPRISEYRSRRYSVDHYDSRRRRYEDRPPRGRPYDDDRRRSDYPYEHHYRYNSRESRNRGRAIGSPYSDKYSYDRRMPEKKSPGRSTAYVRKESRRGNCESPYSRYNERVPSRSPRDHSYQSSKRPHHHSYYESSSHGPAREDYRHHHSMYQSGAGDTRRNSRSPKRYSTYDHM